MNFKWWGVFLILLGLGLRFHIEFRRVSTYPVTAWLEDHRADCAVVLTGGPGRVKEGFDLLSHKEVSKLIISGVHPTAALSEIFPQLPLYGKVRTEDIVLEKRSMTTFGNAQQTAPLLEALKCRDFVLITSYLHMYRAVRTFQGVLSPEMRMYPRATYTWGPPSWGDRSLEALKSLFYSIWAYPSSTH